MAKGSRSADVAATPEATWAVAGDFGGIAAWFPGVGAVRLEGEDRVIDMGGMEIRERLFERSDGDMALVYGVVDNEGITLHRCRVAVEPDGDGSRVTMAYEVEPDGLLPMFDDVYGQAVESLSRHCT